ncbi:MAG: hypothetical protein M3P22_02550 [bacterium]|nr:hypothetical protein [bacterium]
MEILGKILGSVARVKVMRLFLLNKNKVFLSKDIILRSRVSADSVRKEIRVLGSINFLKKKGEGYIFDSNFKYVREFENLLISTDILDKEVVGDTFKKVGKLKLLVVSGIFIKNKDSRVDILLVGDNMKKNKIEESVRKMEAEVGTEMTYAIFSTKDFMYRLSMYDKLVRDILDYPHEVIFQAKELSTQALKKG